MMDKKHLGWILPLGALVWVVLRPEKTEISTPEEGKEGYYLQFNKDQVFTNLLATEEHFRNVKLTGVDRKGFLSCCIKHLGSVESHLSEMVSHALVAEGEEPSNKARELRNKTRMFRHKLQRGEISPEEGIMKTREIRHGFEAFNPDFDISTCEACKVRVEIEGLGGPKNRELTTEELG